MIQDEAGSLRRFRGMIRIPTVSSSGGDDESQFAAFRTYLKENYPLVFERGEGLLVGKRGILIRIPGKASAGPSVLMAHYDVVPAPREGWICDPFSGDEIDGRIYGRGTLDTKCTLFSIMEAVSSRLGEGFVPQNDIYLSFGGEEEICGECCGDIVAYLMDKGVRPAFVLDEGGAVIPEGVPGYKKQAAMIGIAEKGTVNYMVTIESGAGGHASTPPRSTVLGRMARAVGRVEKHPFPAKISEPVRLMTVEIGKELPLYKRLIFQNAKVFEPFMRMLAPLFSPSLNAMTRTTCAVTVMEGHSSFNVLPTRAAFGINARLIHGDTIESVKERLIKIIDDPEAQVDVISGSDPSPVSDIKCDKYRMLCDVIGEVWPGTISAPYPLNGGTDARFYSELTDHVYRFSPMIMSVDERASIHGINESISKEKLFDMIRFYNAIVGRL